MYFFIPSVAEAPVLVMRARALAPAWGLQSSQLAAPTSHSTQAGEWTGFGPEACIPVHTPVHVGSPVNGSKAPVRLAGCSAPHCRAKRCTRTAVCGNV